MRRSFAIAWALLAIAAGGCSSPRGASSLKAGDCFDIPTAAEISTIPTRPCTEPHGGEVFHVFDATADSASYPTDAAWSELIYPVCDPAFKAYTGTPVEERTDVDYLYLVPTSDRFAGGDRRVTCFIRSLDGAPLKQSYRKSG